MDKNEVAPWEDEPLEESENVNDEVEDLTDPIFDDTPIPVEKLPLIEEIAMEYVGFWNRLVSQTNWEKGKVILTWRNKLIEAGIPRKVYTDDAIARRIGNVSGQHVGRLRRVYEQFGSKEPYANLYWSHYQSALDWDDAEDWLQKADQEGLSVAAMKIARWEKYGAPPERKPKESEIVVAELDEDVNPLNDSDSTQVDVGGLSENSDPAKKEKKEGASSEDSDRKKRESRENDSEQDLENEESLKRLGSSTSEVINSLNKMEALPDDLADAFESMKLAILNHKYSHWKEVSSQTIIEYLSVMKALVFSEDSDR